MKMSDSERMVARDFIHLSQLVNTPKTNFGPVVRDILEKCKTDDDYKESAIANLASMAKSHADLRELLEEIKSEKKNGMGNTMTDIAAQVLNQISTLSYRTL